MSQWYQFDRDIDDEPDDRQQLIDTHERAALAAIRAIADLGEAQPDKALIIGAALRKIATVAGSRAQTLSLRSMTIRRGAK